MHLYFRKISKRKKNFNPTYIQYNQLRASWSSSPLSSSLLLLPGFFLCSCCCARGLCSRGVLSFSLLLGAGGGPCGQRDTSGRQRMPWRPETRERAGSGGCRGAREVQRRRRGEICRPAGPARPASTGSAPTLTRGHAGPLLLPLRRTATPGHRSSRVATPGRRSSRGLVERDES